MKNLFITAFILSAFSATSFGQSMNMFSNSAQPQSSPAASPAPAPASGGVSPQTGANGNPSMGLFESSSAERTTDKIFDTNKDSFDLNEGSLNWKGKTFSVGDSRIVRARFERYLATPVDKQNFEKYQEILESIRAQLTITDFKIENSEAKERVRAAWSKLFDAAEYTFDGESSISIANIVAQSWRMQDDFYATQLRERLSKEELDRRRTTSPGKVTAAAQENMRLMSRSTKLNRATVQQLAATRMELAKSMDATYIAEQAGEVAAQTVARQATAINSVFEFQSSILTFFMERKFQQAQISSMFYRNMFKGSRQDMQVGKEKMTELFGITNYIPQITLFESMSTEARKDVQEGMKAVEYLYSSGQLYSALERLSETFVLGEYEPILQSFDSEKKLKLLQVYKRSSTIKKLVDAKDWAGIDDIVKELSQIADDYPATEIMANVRAAQRASNMMVMSAQQAASMGQVEEVRKSLEQAAKIWPLNPAIEKFNEELVGLTQGASKYLQKFDELYGRQNYRDIIAEAPEYGIAFRQDEVRAKKLKEIVITISQIDSMIAQAEELYKQKNPYLAWDILENAKALDSNDPLLSRAISRLAPEVSDYVKMLARASQAEEKKDFAAALNYYLAAQEIFPASQACRLGIERVAGKYVK